MGIDNPLVIFMLGFASAFAVVILWGEAFEMIVEIRRQLKAVRQRKHRRNGDPV